MICYYFYASVVSFAKFFCVSSITYMHTYIQGHIQTTHTDNSKEQVVEYDTQEITDLQLT